MQAATSVGAQDVLIWNGTPSMPTGFYRRVANSPTLGAIVTVRAADVARDYAMARDFIDPSDRFIKRIAAMDGDQVCALGGDIIINGVHVARRAHADRAGRALPSWSGCRVLDAEVFLLGDAQDSFDSRYFGPVALSLIEGVWRR